MHTDSIEIERTRFMKRNITVFAHPAKTAIIFISIFIFAVTILYSIPNISDRYIGYVNAYFLSFILAFIVGLITYIYFFARNETKKTTGPFIPLTLTLVLLQSLNIPHPAPDATLDTVLTYENFGYFFIMIFIAPFLEEVLFRGCLFGALCSFSKSFGGELIIPALVTSLIFSIMHAQYSAVSAYAFEFIVSIILTILRIRTKTLLYPILSHAILNAFAVCSLLYAIII